MSLSPYIQQDGLQVFLGEASALKIPENYALGLPKPIKERFEAINGSKRSLEFLATRFYLKQVCGGVEVDSDKDGVPIWPSPFKGSVSHKDGFIAVAVTKQSDAYVGVDLELSSVNEKLAKKIAPNESLTRLSSESNLSVSQVLALCFSAKETIYKAVYPSLSEAISFEHVCLEEILDHKLIFSTAHRGSILASRPKLSVNFMKIEQAKNPLILTFLKL